jgi:hypothetical protein
MTARGDTIELPIFPLPGVVFFPRVVLPLHIFEARYREMIADALEGDRLIGMVMLQPGYEADYEGRPPVHPIGCVGVIAEATELPDGRYNILLGGLTKFRILREDDSRAYRLADIEPISDAISTADRNRLRDVREDLAALIPLGIPGLQVPDGLDDEDLVNGISQLIDIAPAERLGLLEQPGPLARKAAITSGSRRSVVETLVTSAFGRPRRTGTRASFACHSCVVRSGRSSSVPMLVEGSFTGVGLSHADDAAGVVSRRPCQQHHAIGEQTDGDVPGVAVLLAVVLNGGGGAVEDLASVRHVEATLASGGVTLHRVIGDRHI